MIIFWRKFLQIFTMNIWLIWSFLNNKLFLKKAEIKSRFFLFFSKKRPSSTAFGVRKKLIILTQIFDFYSDLFHSVSISESDSSIFFSLLIDSNTVRSSDFILSSISFSNSSAVIIFTFTNFAQFFEEAFSNL